MSGALVWQLNDTWPATSWAVIDAGGLPKPAYYAIKRELAPLAVQARRGSEGLSGEGLSAWVVSSHQTARPVEMCLDVYTLTGEHLSARSWQVSAAANAVTPLDLEGLSVPADGVVFLRLLENGAEVSRAALWPEPLKHVELPDPALSAQLRGQELRLSATLPTTGIWIDAGPQPVSDNHLDLLPGEQVTLTLGADVKAGEVCVRMVGGEALRPGQATQPNAGRDADAALASASAND